MPSLLPLFHDLEDQPVLVLGAGLVALEKLEKLVHTGARLLVIARAARPEASEFMAAHHIALQLRSWDVQDLSAAKLVIAALNDPDQHQKLKAAARAAGVLLNCVDDRAACDFYFSAQVERGPLQIAISTRGVFPGVARSIRLWLEELLPESVQPELLQLAAIRQELRTHIPDPTQRMLALKHQLQLWIRTDLQGEKR